MPRANIYLQLGYTFGSQVSEIIVLRLMESGVFEDNE